MTMARPVAMHLFFGALLACSAYTATAQAMCGDGAVDSSETCDDGNTTGGDGCSAGCQRESGYVCNGAPSLCCFQDAALAYALIGSASVDSGTGEVTLTPDEGSVAGYAWYKSRISFANDFAIRLQLYLGTKDATGADGGSIIFQRDPDGETATGDSGGDLGATGIAPLVAVEFDDWNNNSGYGDIAGDHVSVFHTSPTPATNHLATAVCMDSGCNNFEDGQYHSYYVEWTAATKTMVVKIERNNVTEQRISLVYDLAANVFGGDPDGIMFGFAASTGGSSNLQKFCPAAPSGFTVPRDGDTDTHDDAVDDDDDNDGILDTEESEDVFGGDDPSADHDTDGLSNYKDKSYWDSVLLDPGNCPDLVAPINECDSVPAEIDADEDGIPNHLDPDSDDDGTSDVVEAGGADANSDGERDGCAPVAPDGSCANGDLVPPDSDDDGIPDTRDVDSDDDGICDGALAVAGVCTAGPDSTRTDACQPAANNTACTEGDSDGDGVLNADECTAGICGNSDTDLLPDYLDTDSDDDGIPDGVECPESPCEDTDESGGPNFRDLDSDGDGFDDEVECPSQPCENTDESDVPDFIDLDSDNDGDPDAEDCARLDDSIGATVSEIVADGIDQDCDGGDRCYDDDDGDGHLDGSNDTRASSDLDCDDPGEGDTTTPEDDCNDAVAAIRPGATELPGDEVDQDCDGQELCFDDDDDDGYLDESADTRASADVDCDDANEAAGGTSTEDCNDAVAGIHPGATEIAGDAIDQDCDGAELCFVDLDGDGFRGAGGATTASSDLDCTDPGEASAATPTGDCDDAVATRHPGALDTCDLIDQDCDGDLVESFPNLDGDTVPDCADDDEDGDGDPDATDCDDADDGIYTGAPDNTCNGVDDDCDGDEDEDGPAHDAACGDKDADGDGIPNAVECEDPENCADTDGDRNADFLDLDSDSDGEPDADECNEEPCEDADEDGIADYRERGDRDTDGDGLVDSEDADADGNGEEDGDECDGWPCADTDEDGIPDPYDFDGGTGGGDSDDDGVLDSDECADWPCEDSDGDLVPDYADSDSDDDGTEDGEDGEPADPCLPDPDAPACEGGDADGDGVVNDEDEDATDPCVPDQDALACEGGDKDGDGTSNGEDEDSDDPCVPDPDALACAGGDADGDGETNAEDVAPRDPCAPSREALACGGGDTDGDGERNEDDDAPSDPCVPSELAIACERGDTDDDGVNNGEDDAPVDPCEPSSDALECGRGDADDDGISNAFECSDRDSCPDLDGDGEPDWKDADDDGDGVPTRSECPDSRACLDTDSDGTDNYRDADDDGDGRSTLDECTDPEACEDSDGDGRPDYIDGSDDEPSEDDDSDGDGRPDADECGDGDACPDTDGDGQDDAHDRDDDDDGRWTVRELEDAENYGEDVDDDGVPNHLDDDSDGDGIPDAFENEDDDEDGVPDYLEPNEVDLRGGGGMACSAQGGAGAGGGTSLLMLGACFLWLRRRRR